MKYLNEYFSARFLMIAALFFAVWSRAALAQSVPPLGAAQSFAVLGGTTITSTGLAVISGNVGVSPGSAVTGFPPAVIKNGQIYSGVGSLAGPAQSSALDAYNNLKGQVCLPANNLSGKVLGETAGCLTLSPGIYSFSTSAQLNATLTLNDGGDPNAIFIFQIGTTLTTASSSQVVMSSGGRGTNVYWQLGTSATIGTSTSLLGHLIANTSITFTTGASTTGRVFALNGAATIDANAINAVPMLKTWDGGAGTNNWGNAANWNPDGVPTSTDDVDLSEANTIDINVAAATKNLLLNNGSLVLNMNAGNSLTVSGNLTLTAGTFNTAAAFPTVSGTVNVANGTVGFTGSGSQTIPAYHYNNLTSSSTGSRTLANSGNIGIAGTFTPGTNPYSITGSTVDYDAGGVQTIAGFAYNNLTLSNTGVKTFGSGTTGVAATLSITGSVTANATTNSSTIHYNGSGDQTVTTLPYYNMTVTSSGGIVTAPPALDIQGNLVLASGTFIAGITINISGNWLNNGTFTPNNGTVAFNGTANQQFTQASGTAQFYNLTINNTTATNTVTFNPATTTVTNQLTLTRGLAVTTGTNEISVTNNAANAVTGQSGTCYVFGRLRRAVNGVRDYDFPVGNATRYELIQAKIGLGLSGTSNILAFFTASTPAGSAPTVSEGGTMYDQVCTGGYWTLIPDSQPSSGHFSLQVTPVGFNCIGSSQAILKRANSSSSWGTAGGTKVSAHERSGFTSFSEVVVATGTVVDLPVRLISFSGQLQNQQVELLWITVSEENNAYFQVERSRDGLHFEPIGLLDGSGTTQTRHTYSFMDTEPLPAIGYYRLRQVDINGQFELSKTIAMKVSSDDQVNLFPNPAQRGQLVRLRITTEEAATYELLITDQQGRIMLQERFDLPEGEKELTLAGSDQFPAGLYVIKAYSTELFALSPYQGKLIVR